MLVNTDDIEAVKTPLTDFLGKEICAGCVIVYPGRQGSSMWMNKGYVVAVDEQGLDVRNYKTRKRNVITRTDRVVVVGKRKVTL